jgi:hypothetical protein
MYETRESQVIQWHDWEYEKENCVYSDNEELIKVAELNTPFKTIGVLFYLSVFITDNDNVIKFENEYPTLEELSNKLKYSIPTTRKYLNILEQFDVIKVIKNKKHLQIYINPKLYFRTMVSLGTHKLFNN